MFYGFKFSETPDLYGSSSTPSVCDCAAQGPPDFAVSNGHVQPLLHGLSTQTSQAHVTPQGSQAH